MSKVNNEWALKVVAVLRSGNVDAAIGQIKVAPTVADLKKLQALLAAPGTPGHKNVAEIVAEQIVLLSAPRLHRSP